MAEAQKDAAIEALDAAVALPACAVVLEHYPHRQRQDLEVLEVTHESDGQLRVTIGPFGEDDVLPQGNVQALLSPTNNQATLVDSR